MSAAAEIERTGHVVVIASDGLVGGLCLHCRAKVRIDAARADDWIVCMGAFVIEHKECIPEEIRVLERSI